MNKWHLPHGAYKGVRQTDICRFSGLFCDLCNYKWEVHVLGYKMI